MEHGGFKIKRSVLKPLSKSFRTTQQQLVFKNRLSSWNNVLIVGPGIYQKDEYSHLHYLLIAQSEKTPY